MRISKLLIAPGIHIIEQIQKIDLAIVKIT